jgi:choline dehydrogenase
LFFLLEGLHHPRFYSFGPRSHLESLGIEVKHDLPGVGENLQDHIMSRLWIQSRNKKHLGATAFDIVNPLIYLKYSLWGNGPLISNGVEAGCLRRLEAKFSKAYLVWMVK